MTYSTIYRIRSRSFLLSGLFYIIHDVSDIQCYARCLLSTRCLSVNYKRANQMCEISNVTVATASSATPIDLMNNDEYHYMDKLDFPAGLIGQCGDSSDPVHSCGIQTPSCSLDGAIDHIMEEKENQLLAHSSCLINGLTEMCDTSNKSWRPHTPNCAGTPPQVRSNATYTLSENEAKVTYECVDGKGIVTFSKYDVLTRSWSLPDLECTPLPINWEDPSPIAVAGIETFVVRPYDGLETLGNKKIVGDYCLVQHKCKQLTATQPISSCPVSRCDGYFNWTDATLSCSDVTMTVSMGIFIGDESIVQSEAYLVSAGTPRFLIITLSSKAGLILEPDAKIRMNLGPGATPPILRSDGTGVLWTIVSEST
ncbi:uncharacterized protein LOC110456353 [Mizuhopecten yessoensis]|uniref:uncharacterized protein LOC110456353 n=1 Tax=Mizuhopecten yessoensis TaxID=6573 RepID=UPI000B45C58D|nr:uncharacterized protein LOC110456353 [Mizuhopecten yessoensis]